MKLAVVALTPQGLKLAQKVAKHYVSQCQIYYAGKTEAKNVKTFNQPLKELVQNLFRDFDQWLFIMSLGIVVRVIAPHIKDKYSDPAVVVMDEQGKHVISVLSGHLGGANALTKEIASLTGAEPVITTASDLQNKIALDVLAREKGLVIEQKENLKFLNSALVRGHEVVVYYDEALENPEKLTELVGNWATIEPLAHLPQKRGKAVAFLTSKYLENPELPFIYLRPKHLILGLGCKAGTTKEEILQAIYGALNKAGRSVFSLKAVCSVDIKAQERGLLEAVKALGIPLKLFSRAQIRDKFKTEKGLSRSEFVQEKIGVEGVCEPTALLGGNSAHLILPKTLWPKVAVAIAEDKWQL